MRKLFARPRQFLNCRGAENNKNEYVISLLIVSK